jgi:conjugal transfer/entry exclusion protein
MNPNVQGRQEMPASQIITNDPQNRGEDVDAILRFLESVNAQGKLFILQENNTILVLILIAKNTVEAHLFTVDEPMTVAHSLKTIVAELRRSEIQRAYSHMGEETPKILQLLQTFGLQPQQSDNPEYEWMVDL